MWSLRDREPLSAPSKTGRYELRLEGKEFDFVKRQLSSLAFESIRDMVVTGSVEPGEPLSEARLGEDLGMSRSPIRTALEQLAGAGLVTYVPGKGYFVATISVAHVTSVMEIREALESFAAARGQFEGNKVVLKRLRRIFEYFADLPGTPTPHEWALLSEADHRFHSEIVSSLNNPVASDMLDQLTLSLRQVRRIAWGRPGRFRTGAMEHLGITDALLGGDSNLASGLMLDHISSAKELLVELMSTRTRGPQISINSERDVLDAWLRSDDPKSSSLESILAAEHEVSA